MFRKITIGLLAFVLALAGAYIGRVSVARSFPGIPAYFSFDGEIFTFDYVFKSGSVGPFSIGSRKNESLIALNHYGKSFILTMPMSREDEEKLYYARQTVINGDSRRVLLDSDLWRIAFREQGAVTIYHVQFVQGQVRSIHLVSTLGA